MAAIPAALAFLAMLAVLALGLAVLHASGTTPLDRTGPLVPVGHALALGAVTVLLWLALAVGRALLDRIGVTLEGALEEILFGTALGAGALGTGMLAMGGLGLARPVWIAVGLALTAVAARDSLAGVPGLIARAVAERPAAGEGGAVLVRAGFAVTGLAAVFLLLEALPPPSDWDSLMYHLQVPALFAERGRVFLPADNLHFTRVGLAHFLYVPFLGAGLLSAPALLSAAFTLLAGLTVFAWCRRSHGPRAAGAALVTFWGSATVLLVAATPRVDTVVVAYLLLAHWALASGLDLPPGRRGRRLALSALLLGLAVGVKFQALVYAAALAPLLLMALRPRDGLLPAVRQAVVYGALAAAAAAPWLLKNWLAIGAPLYPIAAGPVLPPWLVEVLGHRGLPSGVEVGLLDWIWSLRAPFNLRDFVLAPERLAIEVEARHYFANPALLLLPLLLWPARGRRAWRMALPGLLYLALLLLVFPRANLRYLLPGLVPLAAAATVAAVEAVGRRPDRGTASRVLGAALLACLVPSAVAAWSRVSTDAAVAHVVGAASGGEYLASHPDPGVRGYARVAHALGRDVEEGGRILMLFEARGLYIEPPAVQDNKGVNWALLSAGGATGNCLEDAGFSHVLVNVGALDYYERAGLDAGALRLPELVGFRERCLEPAGEWPGYVLFALRPGPEGADAALRR